MAGEITRWMASTPAERQRGREIERVNHQTDVALVRVAGVAEVGQTAMLRTVGLCLQKREAVFLVAPEDAAKIDLIVMTTAVGMAGQVDRLARER